MPRCSDARDRLIASAARLVHERGYSAVSVSDICEAACLRKGSFYHFFPSKRDLVLEVIDGYGRAHAEQLAVALDPALDAREQIGRIFAMTAADLSASCNRDGFVRGCPVGNLALEMADRDEAIRQKLAEVMASFERTVAAVLQRGIARGELTLRDPGATARAIVAYFEGAMVLAKTSNDPAVFEQLAPAALALVTSTNASTERSEAR